MDIPKLGHQKQAVGDQRRKSEPRGERNQRVAKAIGKEEEKRKDRDGNYYTLSEYRDWYSNYKTRWDQSQKEGETSVQFKQRLDRQNKGTEKEKALLPKHGFNQKLFIEMMQSKHEFGPIALARVVNKLSRDRKNIQTCQTFIVRMLEQNQIERNIEDFESQHIAMLANGASKCG